MPSFSNFKPQQQLNLTTFARLSALLIHTAQRDRANAFVYTENYISVPRTLQLLNLDFFVLALSEQFSALLTGQKNLIDSDCSQIQTVSVQLSFHPSEILEFIDQLEISSGPSFQLPKPLKLKRSQLQHNPQLNDSQRQAEFTLALIDLLAESATPSAASRQEQLLNQVVTQIRQSLELPVILSTAVEQIRHCLNVDRLLIYEFGEIHPIESQKMQLRGQVTYESKSDQFSSTLHFAELDLCFVQVPDIREKYQKGVVYAIDDIEIPYQESPCLLKVLKDFQVRSKLIAPIILQDQLWGLLIAHQCQESRYWQFSEKQFLKQIAEHLAIAIYQAKLYAELQEQKQILEKYVSDRTVELQEALIAAQSANRAKGEFLAAMSHELRTPLTCVIGMSATLLRLYSNQNQIQKFLPLEKQRNYLQTIHDSGKHLLNLINDILDLSEVEAGKAVLNISEFSLRNLVRQIQKTVKPRATENQVELSIEVNLKPKQENFCGDRHRIQQILLNLLNNAVKFTPQGGKVLLRVWLENDQAVFQVEDTGIGIAPEQQSLLFQKFQQLDASYTRTYEGMGLGLALTKQLVDLQGGAIEVESTLAVGSTFTVRIPAQPLDEIAANAQTHLKNSSLPQGRLVLIEYHEESAWMICDLLTAAGYQVVWLIEGTAAVKQIEILQPLVVLTAVQLPSIDGYEIIRQLRESSATQDLKILLLADAAVSKSRLRGADDYLLRPVLPELLLKKIADLVARRNAIAPEKP